MEEERRQLLADADRPGGWVLLIDRIRQSYVDLDDPRYLDFEYMRTLADVLDALPVGPLAVTHIGGGALTMARYIAETRPGSPQIVLEPDVELTALIRARLPLRRDARVRIRPVGGRDGLADLRDGSADAIILDAFDGGRVPAELTTTEAFGEVVRVLRGSGLLLANVADAPSLTYVRRLLATLHERFEHVLLVSDAAVLRGRRFGNIELAAANVPLPLAEVRRAAAGAMFPLRVIAGDELRALVGGARPLRDDDSLRSPAPPDAAWRVSEE